MNACCMGFLFLLAKVIALSTVWLAIGELRRGASANWLRNWWRALFVALLATSVLALLPSRWKISLPIFREQGGEFIESEPIVIPTFAAPAETSAAVAYVSPRTTPLYATWAVGLWGLGTAFLLARCAASARRARSLIRGAVKLASSELETEASSESRSLGFGGPVPLFLHERLNAPFAIGWLRPKIVLPSAAQTWEPAKRRMVLQHELAHLWNRDLLWQWIAEISRAIFWPNPLLWMAKRRLSLAQEMAADEAVLRGGACPIDYATVLTETALQGRGIMVRESVAMAMASASNLGRRIERTLDSARLNRRDGGFVRVLTFAVPFMIVAGLSGMQLTDRTAKAEPLDQTPPPATDAPPDLKQLADQVEQQRKRMIQERIETNRLLEASGMVDNDPANASAPIAVGGYDSGTLYNAVEEQKIQVDKIRARVEAINKLSPEDLIQARGVLGIDDPTAAKLLSLLQDADVEEKHATLSGAAANNTHLAETRALKKQYGDALQEAARGIRRAQNVGLDVAENTLSVLEKRLLDSKKQISDAKAQVHEYVDAKAHYLEDKRILESLQMQLDREKKKRSWTDPDSPSNQKSSNPGPNALEPGPGN